MNNVGTGSSGLSSLRVMLCVTSYAMMSMYVMLFIIMGVGGLIKLHERYGWLLNDAVTYSAAWTPEQQKAIEEFRKNLPQEAKLIYVAFLNAEQLPDDASLLDDVHSMKFAEAIDRRIRTIVSGSSESSELPSSAYGSPAHVAAYMGHLEAVKALVEHDDTMIQMKDAQGNTLLARVLTALARHESARVFELAEWLLSKGATLDHALTYDSMLKMAWSEEDTAILEWLLAHDVSPEPWKCGVLRGLPFDMFIKQGRGLTVIERLIKEGKIDVNDRRANWTYLQLLQTGTPRADVTEWLLKMGAKPDLLPEGYSETAADGEEYGSVEQTPLALALESFSELEESDSEVAVSALSTIRILLQYGATPQPFPAEWENEGNRLSAEKVYQEFGHSINYLTEE